jgi:hypothetical protein
VEASDSGGVRDQVQKAIDELRSAGEKATGDVATQDVRKELAKLAVRAQTSTEALDELAKEIDERRKSVGSSGSGGSSS